jgi:PTS system fructose-specific IIA component/PTS system nitrogen regulatory IIA component
LQEFDVQNIFTDVDVAGDKYAAFKKMAGLIAARNHLDQKVLEQGFAQREAESTTGFGNGVAIPHTKIDGLSQPIISIATFASNVEWASLDQNPVQIAIALIMPTDDPNKEHLKVLSQFARKLMDDTFIAGLQENRHDPQRLYNFILTHVDLNQEGA